jgi:hypothetical protein
VAIEDGTVKYKGEIPIGVYVDEVRDLPPAVAQRLGMLRMRAWLFRMAVTKADEPGVSPYTVSFSALPHSRNEFFRTRLRRLSHRSAAEVNRALVTTLATVADSPDPEQRLQEALDRLAFVPFQAANKRAPTLGAWMVFPSRSDLFGRPRFEPDRNYTIGLCREPDLCRELLREDPIVQDHLMATADGTLFLGLPPKGSGTKGPIARPLSPAAVEKRWMALELAIDLALAGRVSARIPPHPSPRSLVARQVVLIYRDILLRWTKREPERYGTAEDGAPDPALSLEPVPDEQDRIDGVKSKLESLGEAAAIQGLSQRVADLEAGNEDMVRLILACPEEWTLPRSLIGYLEASLPHLENESELCPMVLSRLGTAG